MNNIITKNVITPFFRCIDSKVVEVNKSLMKFTGYYGDELIDKPFEEVCNILKINSQVNISAIKNEYKCFIFNKNYEPLMVNIICIDTANENENIYLLLHDTKYNLLDKMPYVSISLRENVYGTAIFTYDGLLLKANNKYFDFLGVPYKEKSNYVGRNINKINDNKCRDLENFFLKVRHTESSYHVYEYKCVYPDNSVKYFSITNVLIKISKNEKYLISTTFDITEKVEYQRLVENQKKELEAIIGNMSDGVVVLDNDYNNYILNNSAKVLYSTRSNTDLNLINFENNLINRVFNGETIKEVKTPVSTSDGEIYVSVSGSPIFDKYGNVQKAILCIRDVTEHVNKDKLIKQQKEELEAIFENISDELIMLDKDGFYKGFNKAARENILINTGKLNIADDIFDQVDQFDKSGKLLAQDIPAKRVLRGEKFLDETLILKNKKGEIIYDVRGIPIFDLNNNLSNAVLIYRDITDKIKYEEKVFKETQYDFINKLIENLELRLIRLSYPDYKIIDINNKAYIGWKQYHENIGPIESLKGENIFKYAEGISKIDIEKAIKNKKVIQSNISIKMLDSTVRHLKHIYQPVYGLNNEVEEIIRLGIDITEEVNEKKRVEKILKMQDELFINISHELKTPLNIIYSAIQLMEIYLKGDLLQNNINKIDKSIDSIKQNCYRLTKLINNILDLSKIESGHFNLNLSNENIVEVVENIVNSVTCYVKEKKLDIIFDSNTEEKIIACDSAKIERVMLNLISNAIKYTSPGGKIFVSVADKGETVEVSVKDNGLGIDKHYLNTIFQRYHQVDKSLSRNAEGSGIGLNLTKSLIELHEGSISVDSEVGEGSEFKFVLPAKKVDETVKVNKCLVNDNKKDMINIEFSDIYDKGWS